MPWLQEVAHGIAASGGEATVEEAVESVPVARSVEELRPIFDETTRGVMRALRLLEGHFKPGQMPPPDLEKMLDLTIVGDIERISLWAAYIYLTNELAKKPSPFLVIPFSHADRIQKAPEVVLDDRRVRGEKESRVAELRVNEALLAQQADQLRREATNPATSVGAFGAFVLSYLALGGVVWPLALLARSRTTLSVPATVLTLALAVTGVADVLSFVLITDAAHDKGR